MMNNVFTALLLLSLFCFGKAYIEYDGWINVELFHDIGVDKLGGFKYRANITISSLNSGLSNIVQEPLSVDDIRNIKTIASQNGFYRLKANVEYPNGSRRTFMTTNKACCLLSVMFNDELWIAIDGNGYVNAITLSSSGAESEDCSSTDYSSLVVGEFNTDVLIKHSEIAPVPDTASFIQKIEREREARDRGEIKDNRGFLAKYWIYIVPVVILLFISGATNPEQQK